MRRRNQLNIFLGILTILISIIIWNPIQSFGEQSTTETTNEVTIDSSSINVPSEYDTEFNKELTSVSPRVFTSLNMPTTPKGSVLSNYFIGPSKLYTMEYQRNLSYVAYRTTSGIYADTKKTMQRRTLKDSLDLNKGWIFSANSNNLTTTNPGAMVSTWTLYNGDLNVETPSYGSDYVAGLSSLGIGTIPNSYSGALITPGYAVNSSLFENPGDAADPKNTRYLQGISTNAKGELKREGTPMEVNYSGKYVSGTNELRTKDTTIVFKYTPHNRLLEIYGRAPQTETTGNEQILMKVTMPSSWNSVKLSWSNVFNGGKSNMGIMGWYKNSGYQNMELPVIYRENSSNGRILYESSTLDWEFHKANTLTQTQAMDLANDDIRNNYGIVNIIPSTVDLYTEALGGIEGTNYKPPITVIVSKDAAPPKYYPTITASVSLDGDIDNNFFSNRPFEVNSIGETVDISTQTEVVNGKASLLAQGWELKNITLANGTVINETAVPTAATNTQVIYNFESKKTNLTVNFKNNKDNSSVANSINLQIPVPDGPIDLTKVASVVNTLNNLQNSGYTIVQRPTNETSLRNDGSTYSVDYMLEKQRSPIMDPTDGDTPFTPQKPGTSAPTAQNPTASDLRIQYVSDFDFGKHSSTTDAVTALSNSDSGVRQGETTSKNVVSFISIIDDRGTSGQWDLNATATTFTSSSGQELKDATISLSNLNYNASVSTKPIVTQGEIKLGTSSKLISRSNTSQTNNSWSLAFGQLEQGNKSSGVTLNIPKGSPKVIGEYQSVINWELIQK